MTDRRCAQAEHLSALIDGEVGDGARARLEAHLGSCSRCAAELASLRRLRSQLRSLPPRDLPEGLADEARRAAASVPDPQPGRFDRLAVAGVLAAVVVVGGAALGTVDRPSTTTMPLEAFDLEPGAVADHRDPVDTADGGLPAPAEGRGLRLVGWSGPAASGWASSGSPASADSEVAVAEDGVDDPDAAAPSWFERVGDLLGGWWTTLAR